jgi:hypothetical protein
VTLVQMCLLEGLTDLDPAVRIIDSLDFATYERQIHKLYKSLGFVPELTGKITPWCSE